MSTKNKTAFVCNDCGADYKKWQGQCTECGAWNSITEVRLGPTPSNRSAKFEGYAGGASGNKIQTLAEIALNDVPRFSSGTGEFDRVLGGG
ncbi:MAG TPA: DNA repair protein RadA, partial [Cellvibrio sp.]